MPTPQETIGSRMQERRAQLGLTLQQVADDAQLTKSTISRYECDKFTSPREVVVTAIARALRVSPAWLMCRTDEKAQDALPPADAFAQALFAQAGELTPENREKLLEMARFFRQQQEKAEPSESLHK